MFLGAELREVAQRKKACLIRTEMNRKTLELSLRHQSSQTERAISTGLVVADLVFSFWQMRKKHKSG